MPFADPEQARAYRKRYYQEHRAEAIAKAAKWAKENPERRAEIRAKWREENPDYHRSWYLANRNEVLERVRGQYQRGLASDPDGTRAKGRETAARRRARVRGLTVERIDFWKVWERDEGICGICREPADPQDWHLDHIVPIAKGGAHSYANVQISHPKCNWEKAAS